MSGKPDARWLAQSIKEIVPRLYVTREYSDVTFRVNQKEFKVHKYILAARSNEFQRILLDRDSCAEKIIDIKDDSVTATGFEILIRFIYTDNIGTEDRQSIIEAFLAARVFGQWALQAECARRFVSWTVAEDVWPLLDAGFTIPVLKDKCLAFIRGNVNEALSYPSFLNISFKCLNYLLDNEILRDVPILKRLNRILEMAANQQTKPVNYGIVRETLVKNNPPLIGKLGIEMLNTEELATFTDSYDGLMTFEEAGKLLKYSKNKDPSYLPTWCSLERPCATSNLEDCINNLNIF